MHERATLAGEILLDPGVIHPQESGEKQAQVKRKLLWMMDVEGGSVLVLGEDTSVDSTTVAACDFDVVISASELVRKGTAVSFRSETTSRRELTMHP